MDRYLLMEIIDKSDIMLMETGHGIHPMNVKITRKLKHFDVILILSGCHTMIFNNTEYKTAPGDIYLVAPGTKLSFIAHENSETLFCHFSVSYMNRIILKGDIKENKMNNKNKDLLRLYKKYLNDVIKMHTASQSPLKSILKIFLYEMILNNSNIDAFISSNSSFFNDRIYYVTKYIQSNINTPLKISSLAKLAGYSQSYFSKHFKELLGTSASDYINNLKLDTAKILLSNDNKSVNDVSAELGYPDQFVFSKKFKKHFGISPLRL